MSGVLEALRRDGGLRKKGGSDGFFFFSLILFLSVACLSPLRQVSANADVLQCDIGFSCLTLSPYPPLLSIFSWWFLINFFPLPGSKLSHLLFGLIAAHAIITLNPLSFFFSIIASCYTIEQLSYWSTLQCLIIIKRNLPLFIMLVLFLTFVFKRHYVSCTSLSSFFIITCVYKLYAKLLEKRSSQGG